MNGRQFEWSNSEAERTVLVRFLLLMLLAIPVGLLGGDAIYSIGKGNPLDFGLKFILIGSVVSTVMVVALGYMSARAVVFLSVPTAITIDRESIVGDFRRKGWKGYSVSEIRIQDIRAVRKTTLLRIPIVRGRPDRQKVKPMRDSAFFYLTESNLQRVKAALDSSASGGPK
jgi:hypothetical protein